ncbi:MAG TPA: hypothetical protein VI911_07455 [Patescibacteria group bacterium]|nr:hypothetical protein [Patescibacteria group bacterium]
MKNKKKEQEKKKEIIEEIETIQAMNCFFKEQRNFCNEMIKEGEKQLKKLMKRK